MLYQYLLHFFAVTVISFIVIMLYDIRHLVALLSDALTNKPDGLRVLIYYYRYFHSLGIALQ